MTGTVRFEVDDRRVGVVTLDRPDKRNALDEAMVEGLHAAADEAGRAAAEGLARAVLVRGRGRAFSAGLDLDLLRGQVDDPPEDAWIAWLQDAFNRLEDLPVPTVAAVHGAALGAGCQLALACHLRLAAPAAAFGLLEVRWGLLPDLGATYRLPRLVGLGRATDLALSARVLDGATAHAWGLADRLVANEGFEDAALAFAAELAAGPTVATGALPRLLRENLRRPRAEALAAERAAQAACLASEDFRAAARPRAGASATVFRGR